MQPPTFIASYNADYTSGASSKTLSITTQPGDFLVVYGGFENGFAGDSFTVAGNGVTFNLEASFVINNNYGTAYIYSGRDNTGGTNWTMTGTPNPVGRFWGFTCLVFRGSGGAGASNSDGILTTAAPTLDVTTTQANSALVVFDNDWSAFTAATTRTWRTVNGITPSVGNGLERTFTESPGAYTVAGAYYDNVGTAGVKTVGMTTPAQRYTIVALEVLGQAANSASIAWLRA